MNRKKCKLAYRVSPSMKSIISSHNMKILNKAKPKPPPLPCNCQKECPMPEPPGECRVKSVIYQASIADVNYVGMTSCEAKLRLRSHFQSFKDEGKKEETALATHIWNNNLNKNSDGQLIKPKVKFKIIRKCQTYKPGSKLCDLCISEKVFILQQMKNPKNINKRTDVGVPCIHHRAHYLKALK